LQVFGQPVELDQLLTRERMPARAEGRFRIEAAQEGFDFLEREAGLLREAQYVDAVNDVQVVAAAARDPGRSRQDSGILVVAQCGGA
jgi:hypothetical protein